MDGCAHDVGGDAPAGIDLAPGAELHHGLTHGLTTLGDRLDLEIVQLIVLPRDLLDGQERGIDGAVAQADTLEHGTLLVELQVGWRRWCCRS